MVFCPTMIANTSHDHDLRSFIARNHHAPAHQPQTLRVSLRTGGLWLGHRLKAGHDIQGFLELMNEQGTDGAKTWFQHMFADLMSPDGIPLPGAADLYRFLENTVGVSEKFFVDWTCVSATDVISGGLSLLILARIYKLATEKQRIRRLAGLTAGQVLLVSLAEANPFFLVTIPVQALLMRQWRKWQLRRLEERLLLSEHVASQAASLLKRIKIES